MTDRRPLPEAAEDLLADDRDTVATLTAASNTLQRTLTALHSLASELSVGLELEHRDVDGDLLWSAAVQHSGSADRATHVPGGHMPVTFTTWTAAAYELLPLLAMVRAHLATLEAEQLAAYKADPTGRTIGYARQAVLADPDSPPPADTPPASITPPAQGVVLHEAIGDGARDHLGYRCQCGHNSMRHAIVRVADQPSTYVCQVPGCTCADLRDHTGGEG